MSGCLLVSLFSFLLCSVFGLGVCIGWIGRRMGVWFVSSRRCRRRGLWGLCLGRRWVVIVSGSSPQDFGFCYVSVSVCASRV